MSMTMSRLLFIAALIPLLGNAALAQPQVLVQTNASWRYFKGTQEASDPVDAWRGTGFNDSSWPEGQATFNYGPDGFIGTVLHDMRNNYRTVFLRTTFFLASPADVDALELTAVCDDGFMAWINGTLVAQSRAPSGTPRFDSLAGSNAPEPQGWESFPIATPQEALVPGENVLAVQVFNVSDGSSDLVFDAYLDAVLRPSGPPTIVARVPEAGALPALTAVTVTFSEPVAGVDAGDLRVNDLPAVVVKGQGTTYTFGFPQPAYGSVTVSWDAAAGIGDLGIPPTPFDPHGLGTSWTYQLYDAEAPAVIAHNPPPSATVRQLSQIEVVFDRPVLGVDAADLLINEQPATSVNGVAAGPYVFTFTAQPDGSVTVEWVPDHGVIDADPAATAFPGGRVSFVVDSSLMVPDVVINEILAQNVNGLRDEDGQTEDWIELHNRGDSAVNLEGWSLTDDPALPGQWTFPSVVLPPGGYLVVFASGKDRRPVGAGARLHTNFKLNLRGEYLGLFNAESPRLAVSELAPEFPEQRNDHSHGLDGFGHWRYFSRATPGAANGFSSLEGMTDPVRFSLERGLYKGPLTISLSCPTPGAEIRYTTDGSTPTASTGTVYGEPITLTETAAVRAMAVSPNRLPSRVETHSYILDVSSRILRLPVISIVTDPDNLYGSSGIMEVTPRNTVYRGRAWERPVSVEWIRPEDNGGFAVDCGIRIQGGDYVRQRYNYRDSSAPWGKYSFRLYFRGDYGAGRLEYPLIEGVPVESFDTVVLRAGMNDATNPFLRDEFARRLFADTGNISPRGTWAHLFLNGVYEGYYNPTERVDLDFLQSWRGTGKDYDLIAQFGEIQAGNTIEWNRMLNYAKANDLSRPDRYQVFEQMLDLTNFADYMLVHIYANVGDWPHNNWRAARERRPGELWRFIMWDAEWSFGWSQQMTDNIFLDQLQPTDNNGPELRVLFRRLLASPEWRLLFADRVHKFLYNGGTLSKERLLEIYDPLRDALVSVIPGFNNTIQNSWIPNRERYLTNHLAGVNLWASANAPVFNQPGGAVPDGFAVMLSVPDGDIFYTTDGSDPRLRFTGAINPGARLFDPADPVIIDREMTVKARTRSGTEWSALTEATFQIGRIGSPVRISEIMYHPAGGEEFEFIEILNTSPVAVDLSGFSLEGVEFHFVQGTMLDGGSRLVLAADDDPGAFAVRYPDVRPAGWYAGSLSNGGERLALRDATGGIIGSVDYDDAKGWPAAADGNGPSLEVIDPLGNPDDPANWIATGAPGGSPGTAHSPFPAPRVRLNEIAADNSQSWAADGDYPDWLELHNPGDAPVNLLGWSLADGSADNRFTFPGIILPAGGYLTVVCGPVTTPSAFLRTGFGLDRDGEFVELSDATGRRVDAVSFGPQLTDLTLGRTAGPDAWELCDPTPGALNESVTLAPVTSLSINEVLPRPLADNDAWIELYNRHMEYPVALEGIWVGADANRARINSRTFLAPGGFLMLRADQNPGPDHLDLKLPVAGGDFRLFDGLGKEFEFLRHRPTFAGISFGRLPDGEDRYALFVESPTPGEPNYRRNWAGPVFNEVLARSDAVVAGGPDPATDWVEIHNPTDQAFDLTGFSLSTGPAEPGEWVFPSGATISAGGHLLLLCDGSQPPSTEWSVRPNIGRSLSAEGDALHLFDPAGIEVDTVAFGFQLRDQSVGRSLGTWTLLATPTPGTANADAAPTSAYTWLRLNEWQAGGPDDDWVEVVNPVDRPISLADLRLTDDPSYAGMERHIVPDLSYIAPGDFVVWQADGKTSGGADHLPFRLDAAGETLRLYTPVGQIIDQYVLAAQPGTGSQGRFPDAGAEVVDFPQTASPGASNYLPHPAVVINEVLTHTDPPLEDAVELANLGDLPVDLGGWWLSDDERQLRKFRVPDGTILDPAGYRVLFESQFFNPTLAADPFHLLADHDGRLFLSETDAGDNLTGFRATAAFGPAENGVSIGRHLTSVGVDFVPLATRTFGQDDPASLADFRLSQGAPNAGPRIGPVVISEIMYHPLGGSGGDEDAALEYVELHNLGDRPVDLFNHLGGRTNSWALSGAVDFEFGQVTVPPRGYLLVVPEFPDAAAYQRFLATYGLDSTANSRLLGPFRGRLANEGETLRLRAPQEPVIGNDGAVQVPMTLVDQFGYQPESPWPVAANGSGLSLQRNPLNRYGNEPLHWVAAATTPLGPMGAEPGDRDNDGLPDAWEWRYGLDLWSAEGADGAEGDPDDDGLSNADELDLGTDPTQITLRFSRLWITGRQLYLAFHATTGRPYRVEYRDNLGSGEWQFLANVEPQTTSGEVEFWTLMPDNGEARFYRLMMF
jgi:hypothetical protein